MVVEDLNGDSVKEIIVGWNLYSLNKQFSVYEPDSSDQANFFVSLGSYQYNLFSVTDINSDSNKEIFFVSLNTSDNIHSASAGVLGFKGGNKLQMLGSNPVLQFLSDNRMLVYAIVLIVIMLFSWSPKMIEWRERVFHKNAKEEA